MRTIVKTPREASVTTFGACHAEVNSFGDLKVRQDHFGSAQVAGYSAGTWSEVIVIAAPEAAPFPPDQEEPVPDESDAIRAAVVRSRMSGWEVRLQQAGIFLSKGKDAEARAIIEDVGREMKP